MANVYDGKITPNVDWGGDSNTGGLPVSGRRVQEFIKEQLELRATKAELAKLEQQLSGKAGTFYYDKDNARYLVFADKESQEAYLADVSKTELILGSFAAGGGTSTENIKVVINLETPMYNAIPLGSKGNYIKFSFDTVNDSGMPTGESVIVTYTITRGANTVTRKEAYRFGANVSFGIDDYIGEGTNVVTVKVMGQTSLASTTFAITFDAINLSIKDYLDISKVYNLKNNAVAYLEIPYDITGSYTKVMEWYLDGMKLELNRTEDEILDTVPTSRVKTIELSNLSQGRHSIQFRAGSKINGEMFYSDTLYRDFFIYTEANYDFMMGVAATLPASQGIVEGGLAISGMAQYVSHTFQVASYSPTNVARIDISIYLDDELVGNVTSRNGIVSNVVVTPSTSGSKTLKLTSETLAYNIPVEVKATDINISEITDGLQLSFSAKGRNNNSSDRDTWTDGKQTATLTGFNWNNQSGWVNNRLEINAGAQLHIAYSPLASHDNGKTLEFEWMSKNVSNENAILCDLRNDEGTGIVITATAISVMSSNKATMEYRYKTDENVRMSVVINPDRGVNEGLTFLYINGVVSKAVNIVTGDNYKSNAEIVFQGTSEAGVSLKDIKVYDTALSTEQMLNNYNLYRDTVAEMLEVYNANDIYDGTSYDLAKMSSRLPVMLVTGDIPTLENTNDKDTQIIVDIEYTNMQDSSRSFVMRGAAMRPQGTSSMGYPKKNFRIYTRKVDGTTLEVNGTPVEDKLYAFKPKSIPVDCWCLKADYAESSGTHNTAIARMWGDAFKNAQVTVDLGEGNPHNTNNEYKLRTKAQQAAIDSKYPYDVRTTIDGLPILLFYRREPNAEVIFLGKYNFNNDKSTEKVFGFTDIPGFDNTRMQCWELLNNGNSIGLFTDISDFYNDVTVDGKVMKGWQAAFESRYPDTKTPKTDDLYNFASWINGVDGEAERFAEEKWNHLDVYKVAGYYCYLCRHAGADQFVKNAMLTSEDGEHFYFILYDNDTINGLNNSGDIAILPTDDRNSTYANGSHKFAGHDSVLWNMLEGDEEFMEVVRAVDNALYSAGISYANAVRYFDEEQASKWVERVYNLDAEYKYISPYTNNGTNNLFMLQGNRSIHRKWWLSNRYSLYDSLFVSGAYKSGYVEIKCVDETMPTQRFTVTSGYPLYYGYGINGKLRERTDMQLAPNSAYTFAINEKVNLGDPIAIYGAPHIKALDLSMMVSRISVLQLAGVYDEVLGTRLENLKLGGAVTENTTLKEISGIKSAKALTSLEVTNLKALTALDLSENVYLQELKAGGTNIASVVFAEGAPLSYVKLPSTFKTLSLKSLPFLETSGIDHENFYAVETINITDCPSLSNNFDWVYAWYEDKRVENSKATLVMDNINWQNVDYRELLALANIGTLSLKGKVKITEGSQEIIDEIKSVFGDNVFNKTSDFYVQAPDGVYLSGPSKLLEGESARYVCAAFSEEEGDVQFKLLTPSTSCSIDEKTGVLTTIETGADTTDITIVCFFITSDNVFSSEQVVTIEKRVYPSLIDIEGDPMVFTENEYSLKILSPTTPITGLYSIQWSLSSYEYATIEADGASCIVVKDENKADIVDVTLTVKLIKNSNNTTVLSKSKTITMSIKGVVLTSSSNSALQSILYSKKLVANENYSLETELAVITAAEINPTGNYDGSIFNRKVSLLTFDELKYFRGLKTIPKGCFYYCTKLTSVTLPDSLESIEDQAFYHCSSLASITIPEGVTSIGGSAFNGCSSLASITIPEGVTSIGGSAFMACTSISSLEIPNVEFIERQTFDKCTSLSSITLSKVRYIGYEAFSRCTKLSTIKMLGLSAPILDGDSTSFKAFGTGENSAGYLTKNQNKLCLQQGHMAYDYIISYLSDSDHGFIVEELPRQDDTLNVGSWINIDQSISDPSAMISGDVNGEHIQMIHSGSHRYLGKYTSEGVMTVCQLDDNDSNYYADGSTATLTGLDGDVFMKMPKFYYRTVGGGESILKVGFFCGESAPDESWTLWDTNTLIGVYTASRDSATNLPRSVSGAKYSYITRPEMVSAVQSRGDCFLCVDWQMHCVMALLFYARYGHTNCQIKIGTGNPGEYSSTGKTDSCGMNDTKGAEPTIGLNDDGVDGNTFPNFWGLENWWGLVENMWNLSPLNTSEPQSIEITERDGSIRKHFVQGNIESESGYLTHFYTGERGDLFPHKYGGSSSTGYCDSASFYWGHNYYPVHGGSSNSASAGISWYGHSSDSLSCYFRLCFRGECVEAESVDDFKNAVMLA